MHLRPAFTRLLVVLLLLQWGTAFSHCLRLAAPQLVQHIEICTPDGLRSVALTVGNQGAGYLGAGYLGAGDPGAGDPAADHGAPNPKHAAAMICPVCGAIGGASLPPPAISLRPPHQMVLVALPDAPATPSQVPAPRPLPPTRAPPTA